MRWQALVLTMLVAASAIAAPQVDIKARTRLALTRVKARDVDQVEVTGQLVDKLTGEGIAGQTVVVTIGGATESALTQADGTFHAIVAAEPGPVHVELGYAGNRALDAADPLRVDTDPAKQQVELAITKLADDPAGARIRVTATGDDGPIDVPVLVSVAPQGSDVFHGLPGTVTANQTELTLSRKAAGGPGMYRLRAAFPGDDHTQAASREVLIELPSQTATTMKIAKTSLAYEDDLVATGGVVDDDGRPVANAAVTLTSGDRRLAQATTDAAGHYRFRVEAALINAREVTVQVQADPGKSYVKASRSNAVAIRIAAPQPVPVSYTVAAFVATVLAGAAFFLARTRPWQRLRKPAPPSEHSADDDAIEPPTTGGLVAARPGLAATLRRPSDDGFAGVVRDTVRGRPIGGATIHVQLGERSIDQTTGDDGAFALEGLPAGEWRASAVADGHVTERFTITIPHRGELRGVRIDLLPVRERVFQLYRRAAEPVLPEPRLWGIWSPRQIVDHVRGKRPTPALSELTDFVEEIYFGPRLAAEGVLELAAERVDRAIQERATRAARSPTN
ncbi:MAG TPA: carboxypeptidase regulatory-like domain-containing protein [Kofleriaceae bacterium]